MAKRCTECKVEMTRKFIMGFTNIFVGLIYLFFCVVTILIFIRAGFVGMVVIFALQIAGYHLLGKRIKYYYRCNKCDLVDN